VNSRVSFRKQLHLVTDHLPVFCISLQKRALRSKNQHVLKPTLYRRQEQQIIESSLTGLLAKTKSGHKSLLNPDLFELGKKI
jgi:hypothetical protein